MSPSWICQQLPVNMGLYILTAKGIETPSSPSAQSEQTPAFNFTDI